MVARDHCTDSTQSLGLFPSQLSTFAHNGIPNVKFLYNQFLRHCSNIVQLKLWSRPPESRRHSWILFRALDIMAVEGLHKENLSLIVEPCQAGNSISGNSFVMISQSRRCSFLPLLGVRVEG